MTKQGEQIKQLKDFIHSPYAWPGGFPLYAVTTDGAALCAVCCKQELGNIVTSISQHLHDGWSIEVITVNWEDHDLYCDHCSKPIESAYGND